MGTKIRSWHPLTLIQSHFLFGLSSIRLLLILLPYLHPFFASLIFLFSLTLSLSEKSLPPFFLSLLPLSHWLSFRRIYITSIQSNENNWSKITVTHLKVLHKHIEQRKPGTKYHMSMLYDSIYTIFKNRQKETIVPEVS